MSKKKVMILGFILLILIVIFAVYRKPHVQDAGFVNLKPSVFFNDNEYVVTKIEIDRSEISEMIAKVSKISNIVSYSESDNPYKSVDYIAEINGRDSSRYIAVRINDIYFLAEINDESLN